MCLWPNTEAWVREVLAENLFKFLHSHRSHIAASAPTWAGNQRLHPQIAFFSISLPLGWVGISFSTATLKLKNLSKLCKNIQFIIAKKKNFSERFWRAIASWALLYKEGNYTSRVSSLQATIYYYDLCIRNASDQSHLKTLFSVSPNSTRGFCIQHFK